MRLLVFLYLAFFFGLVGGTVGGRLLIKYDERFKPVTAGEPYHHKNVTLTIQIARV